MGTKPLSREALKAFKAWGKSGGDKRARQTSPERRREIAQLGVKARKAKRETPPTV